MPVYNGGAFLAQATESILRQTYEDFELLIFDDGSTDTSVRLLEQYASRDERIKLTLGGHRGYVPWLQCGLQAAKGQYIARMDADDVSLPHRFAQQCQFLDANSECVAVGGQAIRIDAEDDILGQFSVPQLHDEIDAGHLSGVGGRIIHPSLMMKAEAVRWIGGYRTEFEPAEDLDLLLRLAEVGRLANLPEVTLNYRVHLQNVTHSRTEQQRRSARNAVAQARRRRGLPELETSVLLDCRPRSETDIVWGWAREAVNGGNYSTARKYIWRLMKHHPLLPNSWKRLALVLLQVSKRACRVSL